MIQPMRRKRSALRLLVVVVALMTIAGTLGPIGALATAAGPPTPPHEFYGTVTDASGDPVADATVQAVYDGEVVNATTTDDDGSYRLKVADPDTSAEDEQVTIRVKNTGASAQYAWASGEFTEHDFQNVQDPSPPTTTTTTAPPTTTTTSAPPSSTTTTDDGGGGGGGAPGGGGGGGGATATTADTATGTTEQGFQDSTTTETRQDSQPTTDETSTELTDDPGEDPSDETDTQTTTEDDGGFLGVPGFGVSPALVALVAAALLALRRSRIDD